MESLCAFLCFIYFSYPFQSAFTLLDLNKCFFKLINVCTDIVCFQCFEIRFVITKCKTSQEGVLNISFLFKCQHIRTQAYIFPDPFLLSMVFYKVFDETCWNIIIKIDNSKYTWHSVSQVQFYSLQLMPIIVSVNYACTSFRVISELVTLGDVHVHVQMEYSKGKPSPLRRMALFLNIVQGEVGRSGAPFHCTDVQHTRHTLKLLCSRRQNYVYRSV